MRRVRSGKILRPVRKEKDAKSRRRALDGPMKTHVAGEQALSMLIDDYKTLDTPTLGNLLRRHGLHRLMRHETPQSPC